MGNKIECPACKAAVIPAALAEELIKEGRLKWPLYTSMTVPVPQ